MGRYFQSRHYHTTSMPRDEGASFVTCMKINDLYGLLSA
jgi:hypothetical protein